MLGIILNLILVALGTLALSAGLSFRLQEREFRQLGNYAAVFALMTFLTCTGYALMGFTADVRYAFIPRLVGLYGIDTFLLTELAFLLTELKSKKIKEYIVYIVGVLYVLLDLLIFGRPSTLTYVRYDFHTAYENRITGAFFFHYGYIGVIFIALLIHGVQWYKSKRAKRDKQFAAEVILVNFVLVLAAVPDLLNLNFAKKYPTFSYCTAEFVIYISFWFALKSHIKFTPTVRNVSQDIFHSVDVPILIFDLDGNASLFNPCAENALRIEGKPTLRSIFTLSDVETLRLLARAKRGEGGKIAAKVKATGADCTLSCAIRLDNAGEPFCIIGTVLFLCGERGV